MPFSLRIKINQNEVEITGTQKEVITTIKELPKIVGNISKAFTRANQEPSTRKATPTTLTAAGKPTEKPITVRLTAPTTTQPKMYPSIKDAKNCSEAVVKLLETEWGNWKPRTMPEVVEALKANALHYPPSTLSGVLTWLVKKGKVRRWKTDAGYVYILAEKEEAA
jgi:hypothetical protein